MCLRPDSYFQSSIFATASSRATALTLTRRTSSGRWRGCSNGGLPYKLPRLAGIRQESFEIRDGPGEAFAELNLGSPMQELAGAGDIRAALPWVILGQGSKLQFRSRANHRHDKLSQFLNSHFDWIAKVNRSIHTAINVHQTRKPFHQIVDIAERSRLRPRAVNRYGLIGE